MRRHRPPIRIRDSRSSSGEVSPVSPSKGHDMPSKPITPVKEDVKSALDIRSRTEGFETILELSGKLDSSLPREIRKKVMAFVKPGCKLVVDLKGVSEVSGQGLRMLLLLWRSVRAARGSIRATGVSQAIGDL